MRYERQIYWGVIAWLFFGEYVYAALIRIPIIGKVPLLSSIARIFSLSDILSDAILGIANGMLSFWGFILKLG